jgi:hypothetical protein
LLVTGCVEEKKLLLWTVFIVLIILLVCILTLTLIITSTASVHRTLTELRKYFTFIKIPVLENLPNIESVQIDFQESINSRLNLLQTDIKKS